MAKSSVTGMGNLLAVGLATLRRAILAVGRYAREHVGRVGLPICLFSVTNSATDFTIGLINLPPVPMAVGLAIFL